MGSISSTTGKIETLGKVKEPWYAVWGERYSGELPPFFNKEELPWTKVLEDNWEVMRDELLGLLESKPERLKPYSINHSMSFPPKHWKTMGLYFWNLKLHKNCRKCPETIKIIKSIPDITSFSLSILEPGSNINPHQGDTDAVFRCHLGLVIPGSLPDLGFQVGKEIRAWEEGKTLPFCDAVVHTAWNHTNERRYIIILDVIRPEFVNRQNEVCAHVLASAVLQMIYPKIKFLNRQTGYFRKFLYHSIRLGIRLLLPIQRALPFL